MTTMYLSKKTIQDICHSAEGQREIRAFVKTLNNQSVIQMFINFKKVETLVQQLVLNDYIVGAPANFNANTFSEKNLEDMFVEFITDKVEHYLCCIKNLESMEVHHGFPMFKEFLTYYLTHPMKPITFFFWMGNFAMPFRIQFEDMVNNCHATLVHTTQECAVVRNLINEAIPLGVSAEVTSLSWVQKNQKTYEKIDFSEIFSAISFDRYYNGLFEEAPNNQIFIDPELSSLDFVNKEEIHRLTNEAFKPMILEIVFQNIRSKKLEDINQEIKKIFSEKPILVYQQYSRALFTVKANEIARIQKELMKFFNKHNIPYQVVSNLPLDPLIIMTPPEGSLPS